MDDENINVIPGQTLDNTQIKMFAEQIAQVMTLWDICARDKVKIAKKMVELLQAELN